MKAHGIIGLMSFLLFAPEVYGQQFEPQKHNIIQTDREDGRFVSSRGFVHSLLKNMSPEYAFNENFTKDEMLEW